MHTETYNILLKLKNNYEAILGLLKTQEQAVSGNDLSQLDQIITSIADINLQAEEAIVKHGEKILRTREIAPDTENELERKVLCIKSELRRILKDITRISMITISRLEMVKENTLKLLQEIAKGKNGIKGYKTNIQDHNIDITE